MKKRTLVFMVGGVVCSWTAQAQEIYTQGGTQGIGIGAAFALGSRFGVHADFNGMNFNKGFTLSGNRYDGDVRLRQGGIYLDYFPLESRGWRITAGVRFNDDTMTAVSQQDNGTYVFQGKRYQVPPGASSTATAKYPLAMPYFGFGFGHNPVGKGFGFIADIGVAYGVPKTTYTLSPELAQFAGANAGAVASSGAQELSDKAWRYRWYPVVQIGVSYRF
ncbi:hypothetical protein AWB79_06438 [Caballeronia hypogeia]|uniref:Outer membrane protein beta-barrel domain-containing protein n=1 Tax=Caballeronia hypogeia TaxID=1777140 RepID=A0A158D4G8_9BURK|nr:hypothetical protein [Caballeronia hypogeia]SAK89574.1 hypothetical protein AWB79_06438 [Caballeronia hypogeia]